VGEAFEQEAAGYVAHRTVARPSVVTILGIDHVQVAGPVGCEAAAREFYGALLGLEELPKPEPLRARGGVWFRAGAQELHVGVEDPFIPATKAHPGLVAADLDALRRELRTAQTGYVDDDKIAGVDRLFVNDPFGNRLEIRQAV
jgi:catechol 2,3-dioxygenase-like lactoylglutathione lyase family enzyme